MGHPNGAESRGYPIVSSLASSQKVSEQENDIGWQDVRQAVSGNPGGGSQSQSPSVRSFASDNFICHPERRSVTTFTGILDDRHS